MVVLHETLHEIHSKKLDGVVFKEDFEKAYDKVKWPFVFEMLRQKGLPDKWINWIMETIRGGNVCVEVNDNLGPYFPTHKGLRQGDSLSPVIFDTDVDALAILMDNDGKTDLIKRLLI